MKHLSLFVTMCFLLGFVFSAHATNNDKTLSGKAPPNPQIDAKRARSSEGSGGSQIMPEPSRKKTKLNEKQVYGIATYDALFKYVLSDMNIVPSFLKTFVPELDIRSVNRLDEHMNPIQGLQLLRNFLSQKNIVDAAEILSQSSNIKVSFRDDDNNEIVDNHSGVHAFVRGMVRRFDDFKKAFPREQYNGTMDFVCRLNNKEYALVEMQVVPQHNWDSRALAYAANLYAHQLSKGDDWKDLKKIISINILGGGKDNTVHWADTPNQYKRHYKFQEQIHDARFIDGIEIIQYSLMNMPEIRDSQAMNDWVAFFREGHCMSEQDVREKIKTPAVLEAFKRAKIKNLPETVREQYKEEDTNYDMYAEHTEQIAQKREEQGLQKGLEQGRDEEKQKIALGMLKHNLPINTITECTGLFEEEIKKLAEKKD